MGNSLSFLPVYGHASPVTYEPSHNEIIDSVKSVPGEVSISFTESSEPRASSIKVINSNNERIDNNDLKVLDSNKLLSVSLDKSKVVPGIYTTDWLVLSKEDGHITKGSYIFSVAKNNNHHQQQDVIDNSSGYSKNITTSDNVILKFNIVPFKIGQNTFNLHISDINETAIENIKNVFLELNNPIKNLGPFVDTMNKLEAGKYLSTGGFLSQAGQWEIKITIQRAGEYDINERFDVDIQ